MRSDTSCAPASSQTSCSFRARLSTTASTMSSACSISIKRMSLIRLWWVRLQPRRTRPDFLLSPALDGQILCRLRVGHLQADRPAELHRGPALYEGKTGCAPVARLALDLLPAAGQHVLPAEDQRVQAELERQPRLCGDAEPARLCDHSRQLARGRLKFHAGTLQCQHPGRRQHLLTGNDEGCRGGPKVFRP